MKIALIDYGAGNIQSIRFAFDRLGVKTMLTSNSEVIRQADRVVFPGVGEASSAMTKLKISGLDLLIPQLTQPVLGICLGMQLMCRYTQEGETQGLGIFDAEVKRFDTSLKVPHMGWNTASQLSSSLFAHIDSDSYFYLVHSYYASICEQTIGVTHYGHSFSSALQLKNFFGVQFHPEKSSTVGAQLLKNFLTL